MRSQKVSGKAAPRKPAEIMQAAGQMQLKRCTDKSHDARAPLPEIEKFLSTNFPTLNSGLFQKWLAIESSPRLLPIVNCLYF